MIRVFNLVDSPVACPILAYVFANHFILFGEDLVLSRSFLIFASNHEFFTSGRLRSLQSRLCDLLESHLEGQKRLEDPVIELEPFGLFAATIDLSELLETLVEV